MGNDEVAVLADAARSHRQLAVLELQGDCKAFGDVIARRVGLHCALVVPSLCLCVCVSMSLCLLVFVCMCVCVFRELETKMTDHGMRAVADMAAQHPSLEELIIPSEP